MGVSEEAADGAGGRAGQLVQGALGVGGRAEVTAAARAVLDRLAQVAERPDNVVGAHVREGALSRSPEPALGSHEASRDRSDAGAAAL